MVREIDRHPLRPVPQPGVAVPERGRLVSKVGRVLAIGGLTVGALYAADRTGLVDVDEALGSAFPLNPPAERSDEEVVASQPTPTPVPVAARVTTPTPQPSPSPTPTVEPSPTPTPTPSIEIPDDRLRDFFEPPEHLGYSTLEEPSGFIKFRSVNWIRGTARVVENPDLSIATLEGEPYEFERAVMATYAFLDDYGHYQEVEVLTMAVMRDGRIHRPLMPGGMAIFNGTPEELVEHLNQTQGEQVALSLAYEREGYINCGGFRDECALEADFASAFSEQIRDFETNGHVPSDELIFIGIGI